MIEKLGSVILIQTLCVKRPKQDGDEPGLQKYNLYIKIGEYWVEVYEDDKTPTILEKMGKLQNALDALLVADRERKDGSASG